MAIMRRPNVPPQSTGFTNYNQREIDAHFFYDWGRATFWEDQINHLRLMQMDVSVSMSDGAVVEAIDLSLVPTCQVILPGYGAGETFDSYTAGNDDVLPGFSSDPLPERPIYVN
jgi:hypothetical protein